MTIDATPMEQRQLILVTGAARCGKSEWAETLAHQSNKAVTYIATATIDLTDTEWQARIALHQQRRPATWQTTAAIADLASIIHQAPASDCLLVDSLGTWVANLLDRSDLEWENLTQELLGVLPTSLATIVLVAEETGLGRSTSLSEWTVVSRQARDVDSSNWHDREYSLPSYWWARSKLIAIGD